MLLNSIISFFHNGVSTIIVYLLPVWRNRHQICHIVILILPPPDRGPCKTFWTLIRQLLKQFIRFIFIEPVITSWTIIFHVKVIEPFQARCSTESTVQVSQIQLIATPLPSAIIAAICFQIEPFFGYVTPCLP